jgi:hypothetical protein
MLGGVLGFLTKLGSPVVVAIVGKVVREIFKAEFSFGKGHGALKLVQVVNYIKAAIKGEHEITVDEDEIVKIVEKTVNYSRPSAESSKLLRSWSRTRP